MIISLMKHSDVCTHIKNEEDVDVLTRESFNVNLRLMKTSPEYESIVRLIASYIEWSALSLKEGYPQPKGWSGPNAGFPLKIIYVPPHGIMLNPEWIGNNDNNAWEEVTSNCGSLTLKKPVKVTRVKSISIAYYTLDGVRHEIPAMTKSDGGYTFQHEYLHCEGELIAG